MDTANKLGRGIAGAFPNTPATGTTALQAITNRLAKISDDADMTSDRLQRVVARAFGDGSSASKAESTAKLQNGEVATISNLLDSIECKMAEHAELVTRLDALV